LGGLGDEWVEYLGMYDVNGDLILSSPVGVLMFSVTCSAPWLFTVPTARISMAYSTPDSAAAMRFPGKFRTLWPSRCGKRIALPSTAYSILKTLLPQGSLEAWTL